MIKRFLANLFLLPFAAWAFMISVGAVQSFWDYLPNLDYKQALVICLVSQFLYSFYDDEKVSGLFKIAVVFIAPFFSMLILGALHGQWAWVPALGYGQALLIGVPLFAFVFAFSLFVALALAVNSRD